MRKFLALGLLLCCSWTLSAKKDKHKIPVIAYLGVPSKEYVDNGLPFEKIDQIDFAFTTVIDNQIQFRKNEELESLRYLVSQRDRNPDMKIVISCGGWGNGQGFSKMVNDEVLRRKYVASVAAFVKENGIDGIDLDWEYPGMPAENNPHKPSDTQNFTLLLKELRSALDDLGDGKILSFAAAGWYEYYNHVEVKKAMKYADFINVMNYDCASGGYATLHTQLYQSKKSDMEKSPFGKALKSYKKEFGKDMQRPSTADMVDFLVKEGVKEKQIVIGSAFYGRTFKNVDEENNGLYQKADAEYMGFINYSDILKKLDGNSRLKEYWDKNAQAPYAYNKNTKDFITYDNPESLRAKTSFAKKHNLGGIMFWELKADTQDHILLNAIDSEASK